MDFVISNNKMSWLRKEINISKDISVYYNTSNKIKERELIYDDREITVLADANIAFINQIKSNSFTQKNIESAIENLINGYILLIDKNDKNIYLYTDIFGFYHLFYLNRNDKIIVSNNYNDLIEYSHKKLDYYAFLDVVLFNYTLLDRTPLKDIKRVKGGSFVRIAENSTLKIESKFNYADNFTYNELSKADEVQISNYITDALSKNLASKENNILTMTGGFDSRILLSALCNQNLRFESITFGQKGNIEIETIKPFMNRFSSHHELIDLDEKYVKNIDSTLRDYLNYTLDCPVSLDLPHYLFVKNNIPSSNLITGFMGGEILSGQSIGAQVTFTEFAGDLLTTKNIDDLKQKFLDKVSDLKILNKDKIEPLLSDYLKSLEEYLYQEDNINILRFFINEKYAKFFGAINKVFRNHSNIVVPFMDKKILDLVLNSEISFLRKEQFQKNPLSNFKVKTLQAKMVDYLCKDLSKTKLDRLYTINDLSKPYRYPLAALGYFKSHYLKTNKKSYPKPHNYDKWYRETIINDLSRITNDDLQKFLNHHDQESLQRLYDKSGSSEKKRLANILALKLAFDKI
ncbi:MAG: hypothetical protein ACOCWG_01190 [bacterium]